MRSLTTGIPNGRNLPPPLGISGLWPVASTLKSCTQFLKIDLRSCRKPLHALPIHSCCPSVRLNFLPCRLKRLGSVHFVDQAEPLTSSDAVFQRRQHAL